MNHDMHPSQPSELSRRQVLRLAAQLGMSVPLAGALVSTRAGWRSAAAQDASSLSIGLSYDVTTLDATMQYDAQTINVYGNIYDTLLTKVWAEDGSFTVQPYLAESITNLDDTTWELKLRQGVTFHNGDPFTGDDVKFTVERVLDPAVASPQFSNISGYDHVEVIDPSTVHIITKGPFPLVPITLCNLRIVPMKYFNDNGAEHVAGNPIGTGPYSFVEWVKGDHVTLAANPNYWNGAPSIQNVIFHVIPEDSTRIAALQTGNADLILTVPPINEPELTSSPDLTVAKTEIERISWIELQSLADSGRPTASVQVRQAICYALDRDALIQGLLLGEGTKVATMLTPKHVGYSPDIAGYEFDLDKAKSLLSEAGYTDGVDLEFMVGTGGQNKELAEAIAGQLGEAGFNVNINLVESAVLLSSWQGHDFGDMILATWTSNTFDADGTLYPLFHSGTVWSNYNNPQVDQLLDQARSLLDTAERTPLYKQAVQILQDEAAGVPLWEQIALYGLNKKVQWSPRPDQELFLVDASISQ